MKKSILITFVLLLFTLPGLVSAKQELTDVEFYGYKLTHHMGAMIKHLDTFGFNTFDHPPMPDHRFLVIPPALDHFFPKRLLIPPVGAPSSSRPQQVIWPDRTGTKFYGNTVFTRGSKRFLLLY